MLKFFILFTLSFSIKAISQDVVLAGKVMNSEKQVLAYTNTGIKDKNVGAISDISGNFKIIIPVNYITDELTFSHIGYKELNIPVAELQQKKAISIVLEKQAIEMETAIVSNKKLQVKKIGVRSRSPFIFGNPIDNNNNNNDINEFLQFIDISNKPSQIVDANIYMIPVKQGAIACRINFYYAENGAPGKRINTVEIIQKRTIEKGWMKFDLSSFNLSIDRNFFVGFEFIPDKTERSFMYGAKLGGHAFVRKSSLCSWEKTSGASLSAYVTVKQ